MREQTGAYIRLLVKEQWCWAYYELDLKKSPYSLPDVGDAFLVRRAKQEDIEKIKTDLYPHMGEKQEYDKRHMECLEDDNIDCFVTEKEGWCVSYFMVFKNATHSPLMDTPFDKKRIAVTDAYLGNAFTVPDYRGMWIAPKVLLSIITYLQKESSATRALLLVHEDTPGAVGFFKRLGFKLIENATSEGLFSKIFRKTLDR